MEERKKGRMILTVCAIIWAVIAVAAAFCDKSSGVAGVSPLLTFEDGNLEVRDGDWVKYYLIANHQVTVLRPDESDPALKGTVDISVHRIDQAWELGDSYKIPEKELLKIRGVVRVVIL